MAKTSSLYIRIDPEIKSEVEGIYARLGINLTQAITTFLYQSRNVGGFPFNVRLEIPNEETRAAIEEVRQMKANPSLGKAYTDVDQMMEELLSDVQG